MSTATVRDRPRRTAVRGARLFDSATASVRPRPTVLLDGPTIVGVTHHADPPPDAELVDLGDVTLLPGLIDTHVHLAFDASPAVAAALAGRDDEQVTAAMRDAARAQLAAGVTTLRDLGDRDYLSLALRGQPDLPTVLAAGPPMTLPDGHCHYLGGCVAPGPAAVAAGVDQRAERGVDVIKVMASGGTLTPGTRQHEPQFSVEELRAVVDRAHHHGLPVTAHVHATRAVANALDAGVDGLEHVTFWTEHSVEAPLELMQRVASSRVLVGATASTIPPPDASVTPPPAVLARMPLIVANMRRLFDLGSNLVIGTDAGIGPLKPHGVLPHAAAQLLGAGVRPGESLRMMTYAAASACGLSGVKGAVAAGHDADILAVGGDPTLDVAALHDVRAVYLRGTRVH